MSTSITNLSLLRNPWGSRHRDAETCAEDMPWRRLLPTEDPEREDEGYETPGGQDGQLPADREEPAALEHDVAKSVVEGRQREGLDERLSRLREPLRREEDAREQPHRDHHQVHQPARGLERAGAGHDQEPDSGEGDRSHDGRQSEDPRGAADRHLKSP